MKAPNFFARLIVFFIAGFFVFETEAQVPQDTSGQIKNPRQTGYTLYGAASFYAEKFHGRQTANGEIFSRDVLTAACNVLPLGTWIQVTNIRNGKIVVVKTNDRLHPKNKRLIDLSMAAARKLGFVSAGLTRVKIIVLDQSLYNPKKIKIKGRKIKHG